MTKGTRKRNATQEDKESEVPAASSSRGQGHKSASAEQIASGEPPSKRAKVTGGAAAASSSTARSASASSLFAKNSVAAPKKSAPPSLSSAKKSSQPAPRRSVKAESEKQAGGAATSSRKSQSISTTKNLLPQRSNSKKEKTKQENDTEPFSSKVAKNKNSKTTAKSKSNTKSKSTRKSESKAVQKSEAKQKPAAKQTMGRRKGPAVWWQPKKQQDAATDEPKAEQHDFDGRAAAAASSSSSLGTGSGAVGLRKKPEGERALFAKKIPLFANPPEQRDSKKDQKKKSSRAGRKSKKHDTGGEQEDAAQHDGPWGRRRVPEDVRAAAAKKNSKVGRDTLPEAGPSDDLDLWGNPLNSGVELLAKPPAPASSSGAKGDRNAGGASGNTTSKSGKSKKVDDKDKVMKASGKLQESQNKNRSKGRKDAIAGQVATAGGSTGAEKGAASSKRDLLSAGTGAEGILDDSAEGDRPSGAKKRGGKNKAGKRGSSRATGKDSALMKNDDGGQDDGGQTTKDAKGRKVDYSGAAGKNNGGTKKRRAMPTVEPGAASGSLFGGNGNTDTTLGGNNYTLTGTTATTSAASVGLFGSSAASADTAATSGTSSAAQQNALLSGLSAYSQSLAMAQQLRQGLSTAMGPLGGGGAGGALNILSTSSSSSTSNRWTQRVADLKASGTKQMMALMELNEVLQYASEDMLVTFPMDAVLPLLIGILCQKGGSAAAALERTTSVADPFLLAAQFEDADGGFGPMGGGDNNDPAESQKMILACQILYSLLDIVPTCGRLIASYNGIPPLVEKLTQIDFIDVAEQIISLLDKLVDECPVQVLQNGGLLGMLQFLDFHHISLQRKAVGAANKMLASATSGQTAAKLRTLFEAQIRPALTPLSELLTHADAQVTAAACECWRKVLDATLACTSSSTTSFAALSATAASSAASASQEINLEELFPGSVVENFLRLQQRNKHFGNSGDILYILAMLVNQSSKLCERALELEIESEIRCALENEHTSLAALSLVCSLLPGVTFRASVSGGDVVLGGGGEPSAGGQSTEKTAGSGAGLVSRGSSLLSKLFFGGSPKQGEQGPSPKQEGASATGSSGGRKEDDAALSTDAIVEKKQAASYCSTPKLECTHLEFAIQNAAPEEQQRLQLFKENKFRNLVKLGAASLKQVLRQKAGSSVSRAMGLNCVLPFVLLYRDGCEQGVSAEDVTELKGLLHACLDVSQLHTVTSESGYLSFLIIVEGLLRAEEADSGREGPGEKNLMHLYLHRQGVFKTIADNVEQCEKKLASQLASSSSSASSTSNVGGAPLSTAEQQATQEQGPGGFTPLMLIAVLSKKILQNFASTAEILHESTLAAAGGEDHSNDAPLDEDDEEAHQQLSPYRISASPCATVAELLSLAEDAGDHGGGSAYKVDCARTKQAFRLLHAALREDAIAPEEVARDLLPKLLPMFFFDGQEAGNSQLSEQGLRGAGADVAAHLRFFSSFLHTVFEGGDQHQTDEVHGDGVVADNCKIDYHAALLLCRKFAKLCLACLTPQLVETLPIFLFPQSGSKDRDPLMQALNGMGSRFMGGRYGPFGAAGSAAGQMNSALPHHLRSVGGGVVENALLSENVRQLGKPVKIRLAAKGPGGATKAAAPAFTSTSASSALGGGRSGTSSKAESRIGSAGAAFEKKVRKAEKKRAAGAAKLGEAPAEDDYVLKTTAASAGDPPAGVPSSSSAAAASGGSAAAPSLPPTSSATTTQQQQMVDVLLVEPLATIAAIEDYVIERHGVPSSVKPLIYGPSGRRMESDTSLVRAVTEYLLLGDLDLQAESSAGIGGPSSSTSSGALLGRTGSAASASAAAAAGFGSSSTNDEGGLPNKSPTILDAGLRAAFTSEGTTGTEPFTLKPGQRFFASARDCVFAAQSARRNNASATSWGTTLYYEIPTAGTTATTSVAKQGNKQESSSLSLMAEPSVVSKSEAKAVTKPNVALGQRTGSDLNPAAKKENDDKWNLPDPDKLRGTSSNKKNALAPGGKKSGNKAAASKAGAEQTDAKGWASFMSDFSDDDEDAEDHYIGGGKNLAEGIAAMGESPESAPATALDSPVESPALPGLGKTSSAGSLGLAPFGGAATGSGLDGGSGSIFGAAAGPGAASGTLSSKGVGEGASFKLTQSGATAASLGDALLKPTTSTLSSASSASSFQEYQAAAAPAADRKPKDPAAEVTTKAASGSAFPPDAQYKVKAYKYSATSSRTKHKLTTEIRREVPAFGAPMVFQDELEALAVRIHQTRAAFSVLCRDAYTKSDRFAVVLSPDSRSGAASGSGAAGSSGGAAASSAAARSCAVETASSAPGVPRSRGPDLAGEQRRRTSAASSVVTAVQAAHFAAGVGAGARSAAAADDRFSKLCVADEKLRSAIDFLAVLHHVAEYYERKCRASQASAGGGLRGRSAALREGRRGGGIRNPRGSQEARACDARGHGGRQQLRLMDIDDEDGSVDSHGLANDIDSLKFRMKMSSGSTTKQVVDLSLMDHINRGEPENENEDSGDLTGGEPALEADGGEARNEEEGADCLAVQPFRLSASSGRATTDGAFSGELSAGASSLIADALNEHCLRQMHDPVSVAARSCAKWVLPLACRNPFLFSATSKKEMHQGLCLGLSRALHFAQNRSQHAGSTAGGNRSVSSSQQVLAPMPRQKVRIQRNKMLESAQKLMSLYGMSPAILEVEFANEVGTGSGPTLEFYSTVVDLLKEPVVGGGSSSSSSSSSRLGRETTAAVEAGGLIAAEMKGSGLTLDAAGQTPPLPPELSMTTKKTPLTSLFRDASANYLFPAPTTSHASRYKHHAASYFRLLGQIVGKALLDSRFVDLPLHPLFWRVVKSTEELPACFTMADLKQVDSELYESLMKLRELSDDDLAALEINFTLPGIADEGYDLLRDDGGWRLGMSPEDFWAVGDYRRGMAEEAAVATFPLPAPREQTQTLGHDVDHRCAAGEEGVEEDVAQMKPARRRSSPLKPGKETFVTNQAELAHYIHLVAYHTLYGSVKELVHEFRTAFLTLHSLESIKIYSEQELAVLIVGASTRDNRYWQVEQHLGKYVQPSHGFSPESATFRNLLEVMQELDWEQRKKFLSFVTGAHSLPPNGFAGLRPLLQVAKKDEKEADNFLPSVMTCANYLKLPDYSSKEVLREKLFHAIRGDSQSFLLS
eukprot:CAMPEP_0178991654 /NCGR_PEP_ID=MMETSP0795-20121207/5655_1 /TAXON_ID=88552 /ORGANISM="Amoebophrya sp., Strain Ameob2" /LENGTH=3162 /DNA_ID=CAMNT_0020683401 /DNA_START=863 /DNA_END=10354 /DNA_ORIENTATION=-